MGWMRTDFHFDQRGCCLELSYKRAMQLGIKDALQQAQTSPDIMVGVLGGLIDNYRPDLKGCFIYYFGFDARRNSFLISVMHNSLEPIPFGCEPPTKTFLLQDQPDENGIVNYKPIED